MYQSQTRPKCTIMSQKIFFNLTRVAHQKFWVSPRGPQERSCRGAAKSLNMALVVIIISFYLFIYLGYGHCLIQIIKKERRFIFSPLVLHSQGIRN